VDRLAVWFKETVETSWRPEDADDKEFQTHLAYVFWQILQWLRYEGLSQNAVEGIGRLLRRLVLVYQAYRAKKQTYTKSEWLAHLLGILSEAQGTAGK